MPKPADTGTKRLISLAPNTWARWISQRPNVVVEDIITSEFQWISRHSDALLRVRDPEVGEHLILNEIQLRVDGWMPTRTRAYAALAEHKYRLPVYPVVLNILRPPPHVVIPTCYDSHFLGLHAHQDYRVINMWDVPVDVAFQPELSPLLPFVPVLHGGDNEPMIRKAVRTLRTDKRLGDLEPLLGFFAMFVLSRKVVE